MRVPLGSTVEFQPRNHKLGEDALEGFIAAWFKLCLLCYFDLIWLRWIDQGFTMVHLPSFARGDVSKQYDSHQAHVEGLHVCVAV